MKAKGQSNQDPDEVLRRGIANEFLKDFEALDQAGVADPKSSDSGDLSFPEVAWRGSFADYRKAMEGTTEASEVVHFAAFWLACAIVLGRRAFMYAGQRVYPNVYLIFYGDSGDKKTTAQRRIHTLGVESYAKIIPNVGSAEGLAEHLGRDAADPNVCLFFWEEISSLLSRARWSGSSVLEFLTEAFYCPPEWGLAYRKQNSVVVVNPTPNILAGTTADWFWKNAKLEDFYGGFANRFVFFTGRKNPPIPDPQKPDETLLQSAREALARLASIASNTEPIEANWTPEAKRLWAEFYRDWESRPRQTLQAAALKRVHVYIRKLALTYAALEGTLPQISRSQIEAAIAVCVYGANCTEKLLDVRSRTEHGDADVEQRILRWVEKNSGGRVRHLQQAVSRYAPATIFNRVLKSLREAERIRIEGNKQRRVFLAT